MAKISTQTIHVADPAVRQDLKKAAGDSGDLYEKILGGCISRRVIPILEMIEDQTGIPVVGTSMDKTRGPRSSQSGAWFQWQRGHSRGPEKRRPEGTIEFKGPGGVITHVFALEISLQSDIPRIGSSRMCEMSMHKASQIGLTAALLANKPAYKTADIQYWYLCPWQPTQNSIIELLTPLQKMKGTENVTLIWWVVDHGS